MADQRPNKAVANTGSVTRFDAGHTQSSKSSGPPIAEPEQALLSAAAGTDHAANAEQLTHQASQLAGHLRTRQRELDLRESNLNSRVALLESELRAARLRVQGREQALEPVPHTSDAEHSADPNERTPQEQRNAELEEWSVQLHERQARLETTEGILQTQLADLESETVRSREALQAERAALEAERDQMQTEMKRFRHQAAATKVNFEVRRRQLDGREIAAKNLNSESFRLQRASLEHRLEAEQVSLELRASTSPAERMRSLSQIRQRLAEQLRHEREELRQQHQSLEELSGKMDKRVEQIRQIRRESEIWLAHREREIEEQAVRLVAREVELNRQQQELHRQHEEWAAERRRLQSQVREMLTKGVA